MLDGEEFLDGGEGGGVDGGVTDQGLTKGPLGVAGET